MQEAVDRRRGKAGKRRRKWGRGAGATCWAYLVWTSSWGEWLLHPQPLPQGAARGRSWSPSYRNPSKRSGRSGWLCALPPAPSCGNTATSPDMYGYPAAPASVPMPQAVSGPSSHILQSRTPGYPCSQPQMILPYTPAPCPTSTRRLYPNSSPVTHKPITASASAPGP